MKKTVLILTLALFIGIFAPAVPAMAEPEGGQYIVKLKEPDGDAVSLMSLPELDEISQSAGLYRAESLEEIERLGDAVEYYEEDCEATLFGLTNDTYSDEQWNLPFLSVGRAWDRGYDGGGVRVAVIDSGVNSMHEDFELTDFERGSNMLNGSHDVSDGLGHGTMVCGVLAATGNNGKGIAGLCDRVTVIPIKCFSDDKTTDSSYVISGIYEAVDIYDCDVINLSLGMVKDLRSLRQAIDHACEKGVIVISAVGNEGNSVLNYPAAYDNVVGVGSVDADGIVSDFSNRNRSVYVTAPGEDIVAPGIRTSRQYRISSGTSDSAPMVTGAAVMFKQLYPNANVEDFKTLLRASVRDAGPRGYDTSYGYGILDLGTFTDELAGYVFPDVSGHWAENSVSLCVGRGYFRGVSERSFMPEQVMNRAMFVTLLSRVSGEDLSGYTSSFTDVPSGSYYAEACAWGAGKGIILGDGSGAFLPENSVTREQMATFLYRFAKEAGMVTYSPNQRVLSRFSDSGQISGYAREGMSWAVEQGLMSGRGGNRLAPGDNATRAEVAAMIERFAAHGGL